MSAEIEGIVADEKNDDNLVSGCLSKVWLVCESRDCRTFIRADSEALIIKGIVSVIVQLFNGRTDQEIIESEIDFIDKTSLKQQISTDRFHGMHSVINKIKQFAKSKSENS